MNDRRPIAPADFTPTIGAYSHGLVVHVGGSELIFVTGQIAMGSDGAVVCPGDASGQAEFIFENIRRILEEAGSGMDDVVKVQIFLTNIDDFSKVSPVRNRYLERSKPVSTMLEVSRLVKPDCCIEVEVVAVHKVN